ncbi:hypothetical protein MRB53_036991 [Persea americana]|nr:hypothetical protein MRB53_036991 [Persea americana]
MQNRRRSEVPPSPQSYRTPPSQQSQIPTYQSPHHTRQAVLQSSNLEHLVHRHLHHRILLSSGPSENPSAHHRITSSTSPPRRHTLPTPSQPSIRMQHVHRHGRAAQRSTTRAQCTSIRQPQQMPSIILPQRLPTTIHPHRSATARAKSSTRRITSPRRAWAPEPERKGAAVQNRPSVTVNVKRFGPRQAPSPPVTIGNARNGSPNINNAYSNHDSYGANGNASVNYHTPIYPPPVPGKVPLTSSQPTYGSPGSGAGSISALSREIASIDIGPAGGAWAWADIGNGTAAGAGA